MKAKLNMFTVHYTTEVGSSASEIVAAHDVADVIGHYPNWDTIQRDGQVLILDDPKRIEPEEETIHLIRVNDETGDRMEAMGFVRPRIILEQTPLGEELLTVALNEMLAKAVKKAKRKAKRGA